MWKNFSRLVQTGRSFTWHIVHSQCFIYSVTLFAPQGALYAKMRWYISSFFFHLVFSLRPTFQKGPTFSPSLSLSICLVFHSVHFLIALIFNSASLFRNSFCTDCPFGKIIRSNQAALENTFDKNIIWSQTSLFWTVLSISRPKQFLQCCLTLYELYSDIVVFDDFRMTSVLIKTDDACCVLW